MLIDLKYLCAKYKFKPKGVIHIGAHTGEEQEIYDQLKVKNVVWIEAIPSLYYGLKNKFIGNEHIKILNEAVSAKKERTEFIVTNNMASSSLLELKEHLKEHPSVEEFTRMKVKTRRMDDIIEKELNIDDYDFVNLDIQGMELEALKGFGDYIDQFLYIYTEVNEKELYKDCCRTHEIDEYLGRYSFKRVETQMSSHGWGDAFYKKYYE